MFNYGSTRPGTLPDHYISEMALGNVRRSRIIMPLDGPGSIWSSILIVTVNTLLDILLWPFFFLDSSSFLAFQSLFNSLRGS